MEDSIFRHKLSNNLETLVVEKPNTGLFFINIIVKVGLSKLYQSKEEIENAHFLEHFNAKFTSKKYPKWKEINSKLEFYGIFHNAFTSHEITSYWLYGSINDKEFIMDLLLNSYTHFQADNNMLEKEREAILNELHHRKIDYNINFYDNLYSMYNIDYNFNDRINNIKKVSLDKLIKFRDKYYHPDNTKIIIIGDIKHKPIFNHLDNFFNKNEIKNKIINLPNYEIPIIDNNIIYNKRLDMDNTLIKISFQTNVDKFSLDKYIKSYIINILEKRLLRYLRHDGGKIYSVSVGSYYYINKSFIVIQTEFRNKENVEDIFKIIFDQINRINLKDISESRYIKTKNIFKLFYLKKNLNNDFKKLNSNYIDEFINDKPLLSEKDKCDNYMNVSLDDVKKLSKGLFNFKNMVLYHYGKHDFTNIIKKTANLYS